MSFMSTQIKIFFVLNTLIVFHIMYKKNYKTKSLIKLMIKFIFFWKKSPKKPSNKYLNIFYISLALTSTIINIIAIKEPQQDLLTKWFLKKMEKDGSLPGIPFEETVTKVGKLFLTQVYKIKLS